MVKFNIIYYKNRLSWVLVGIIVWYGIVIGRGFPVSYKNLFKNLFIYFILNYFLDSGIFEMKNVNNGFFKFFKIKNVYYGSDLIKNIRRYYRAMYAKDGPTKKKLEEALLKRNQGLGEEDAKQISRHNLLGNEDDNDKGNIKVGHITHSKNIEGKETKEIVGSGEINTDGRTSFFLPNELSLDKKVIEELINENKLVESKINEKILDEAQRINNEIHGINREIKREGIKKWSEDD